LPPRRGRRGSPKSNRVRRRTATDEEEKKYKHAQVAKKYSGVGFFTGPGMGRDFLPLGLACSFFVVWIWGGVSSPASVLRVMATKSTATLRRSIVVLSIYNLFIYLPLIVVCICARSLMPDLSEPTPSFA
jgi:hypothetical protein